MTVQFPGRPPRYERWRYTYRYVPPAPVLFPGETVTGVFDVEEPGTYRSFTRITEATASIHVHVRGDVRYAPGTALVNSSNAIPPGVRTWVTQLELHGGERVTTTVSGSSTGYRMHPGDVGCELLLMTPTLRPDALLFRPQNPLVLSGLGQRPLLNVVPYVLERCGLTPWALTPGEYANVVAAILRTAHRDVSQAVFEVDRSRYVSSTQQMTHDPAASPYAVDTGVIPSFSTGSEPTVCRVQVKPWHGGWRIECACGTRGEVRPDHQWADADLYNHVVEYETRLLRESNVASYGDELAEAGRDANRTRETRSA